MIQKFGIFMAVGAQSRYANITGNALVRMHIMPFDTAEDAQQFINDNDSIAPNAELLIIPYYEHRKPMPQL